MVAASPLPKTGLSLDSFSTEESGRRFESRSSPRNGVIWSSRKPASYAAASRWCEAAASSSCSSRLTCHSRAVRAACSPIDRPVRGSPFWGISRPMSVGRIAPRAARRPLVSRAALTFISFLRSLSLIATGASEVVSVPPAIPTSIWPSAILLATWIAAWSPVAQACWMSAAGVSAESFEPSTDSRVRLKSRACLRTAPATTSPRTLALESEPGDQAVDRGGQHLLVGGVGVGAVGARERDSVAADDGDPSSLGGGVMLLSLPVTAPRRNGMSATSRNVDSELHVQLHELGSRDPARLSTILEDPPP